MQRQKSILSFFQKPSPVANHGIDEKKHSQNAAVPLDTALEIQGTDTPPEKVPRKILPANFSADQDAKGPSLFSSIMHKFVRVDDREKPRDRVSKQENSEISGEDEMPGPETPGTKPLVPRMKKILEDTTKFESNGLVLPNPTKGVKFPDLGDLGKTNGGVADSVSKYEWLETSGSRPLVQRMKRILEDTTKLGNKVPETSKRVKFLDSVDLAKTNGGVAGSVSKYEWLDSQRMTDANGRRPDDPLYDRKTLYVPPDVLKKMSPTQKQYWSVKSQYMDIVLFFKVGTFYELYELDAEIGHQELDWKMTTRGVGQCRQVGIAASGIDDAVEKLVARGYKVGRMEQLETSDQAKAKGSNSIVSRKLVQVVTPSTTMDGYIGPEAVHLLAIKEGSYEMENGATIYGFAFVDCAALRFWVGAVSDDASSAALGALLMQVSPREVIYENRGLSKEVQKALRKYSLTGSMTVQLTPVMPATDFVDASEVRNLIQSMGYFSGSSNPWNNALDSIVHRDIALSALGGLIGHLSRLMLDDVLRSGDILPYQVYRGCLRMDGQTLINLEIFCNNADGGSSGTLFKYLDSCLTSSGKRLLRKWICHPLQDVVGINNRLDVVEYLMEHTETVLIIGQHLRKLPDLERLLGRVKASFQETPSLSLPLLGKKLLKLRVRVFGSLVKGLRTGMDLLLLLQQELQFISLLLRNFKLPELNGSDGLDKFLTQFEAAVDIEFPNYKNHDVTDIEADTLSVLAELFIERATQWSEVIHAINCIDVLRSFAFSSSMSCGAMSRPVVLPQSKSMNFNSEPILKIEGLWHPFALGESGALPVPNDLFLGEGSDGYGPRTLLLTGPNMGGKSTILRATCLAVILAQLGCFVPSEKCVLSLVDIIFTRLGATDRIMTGESTFLIECTETASVLQNATQDSLVILDELGRGTSTFDGYAIAYAVFRHLVEKVNCRLLFATHYHPLTKEFASHPHVKLQHMACAFNSNSENYSKGKQDLVFLYRLTSGACPESYGMQVAIMAGIPEQVVEVATCAGQVMKKSIGESFKSSELRSEFSTLHEQWLKSLVNASRTGDCNLDDDGDDVFDTLFCLWHELKNSYGSCR